MANIKGEPGERVTVREEASIYMLRSGKIVRRPDIKERRFETRSVMVLLDGEDQALPFWPDELRKEEPARP